MILANDNFAFATIVYIIEQGLSMCNNMQAFIRNLIL